MFQKNDIPEITIGTKILIIKYLRITGCSSMDLSHKS